jgi:hypothetical protein
MVRLIEVMRLLPLASQTFIFASLRINVHSFLSPSFYVFMSSSTSSNHLNLGLPTLRLPSGLVFNIICDIQVCSILMTCLSHPDLIISISVTIEVM